MKIFRTLTLLVLCIGLLFAASSCLVVPQRDNGRHRGYYKHENRQHRNNHPGPQRHWNNGHRR